MSKRIRVRRRGIPIRVSWTLFHISPLFVIIGDIGGGLLLVLIVASDPFHLAPLWIGVAIGCLAVWAVGSWLVLTPPAKMLARVDASGPLPALVWPIGLRVRRWGALAGPWTGAAALVTTAPLAQWVMDVLRIPWHWPLLLLTAVISVLSMLPVLCVWRVLLFGVEITMTAVIVRGPLRTRHYRRESLVSADAAEIGLLRVLFSANVLSLRYNHALRLRFTNGQSRVLYCCAGPRDEVEAGARMVRAWQVRTLAAGDGLATTTETSPT